jgi:hypothetical protein
LKKRKARPPARPGTSQIRGCVPGLTDYGGAYTIRPGNQYDAQGVEELVYGFANAGIAGKIVMAKNKTSWHEPWPEHLQCGFDRRVEVGVEQDKAPPEVFEAREGC